MTKLLDHALEKVQDLPSSDQDRIARDLKRYVDDLQRLRADLREGIASLDAGKGKVLDIEAVIARANHGDSSGRRKPNPNCRHRQTPV